MTEIQQKVVSEVCQKLKEGKTLKRIFYFRDGEHLPPLTTFLQWMEEDAEINVIVNQSKVL